MAGLNVVGVQFRRSGKIYDFDGKDFLLNVGDQVVVDTERGPSLAEVMKISWLYNKDQQLKSVMRVASVKDLDKIGRLTQEKADAVAREKIRGLELDMRVISVEIQLGGNKVIVYFSAPGRVDFRELVKELATGLKTRVELKQVGARDEAKLTGGMGICGREFCCSSFLREFVPVSIKMAKNQNLALNPNKVSGGCGRLLCCLTYENSTYSDLRKLLPPKGTRVKLEDDSLGDVLKGDVLNQSVLIELDSGEQITKPLSEVEEIDSSVQVPEDDWGDDLDLDSLMDSPKDSGGGSPNRDSSTGTNQKGVGSKKGQNRQNSDRSATKGRKQRPNNESSDRRQKSGGQQKSGSQSDKGNRNRNPKGGGEGSS